MIPYYIFFIFFGFGALLDNLKQDDDRLQSLRWNVFFIGFFLILFFVGFRYKLGSDWLSYLTMYNEAVPLNILFQADNLSFASDFTEPGFKIIMSLSKEIGINYAFFVFLLTLFNTISLFYFLYKNKIRNKLIFLALILILTTFYEFDILRQSLAFHIVLFSLVGDKIKFWKLISFTLLAMTFHYTAIIFVVFYFFQKLNITRKGVLMLSLIYFISLFVSIPLLTTVLKFLEPIVDGNTGAIISKAIVVVQNFGFQRGISLTSILNLTFLILLAIRIKTMKFSSSEKLLIKAFLFYIIINILFKEIQEVTDRFSYYFNIGIAFMFCLLNDFVLIRERKMILMFVPLLFIIMRLSLHFSDIGIRYGQTPYRNYLFIEKSDEQEILLRYDKMQSFKSDEIDGKKD
ncbi:hypothetical protein RT99_16895 [Flavobacterium sp. MEB061]|uniref:EpsG family protein n=1 Tax=Flavobacterium sp. MEB061 TaxID=1587524 RepID=UPI0005ACE747|nr:EpsG family protein [Flavobacterium sp. MEB061]KIQ18709.1 hypothetical protein RT99_16895 [Flavobacterium sp. MEB061]